MLNDYTAKQISQLQSEIHELQTQQIRMKVQLDHVLEERKDKQEFQTMIWRGCSLMIWFAVCFLMVILVTTSHHIH